MPQSAAQGGGDDVFQRAATLTLLRRKTPGERIAFLRREKGWSQNDLAAEVREKGASCSGKWKVCRWEGGMRPREDARRALSSALGVTEQELFG